MLSKRLVAFALAIVLFSTASFSQDDDIKQVIAKETDSYFKRDIEGWKSVWLEEPDISRTFVNVVEFFRVSGRDSLMAKQMRSFDKYPKPEQVEFSSDSFTIRKDGNIAVVDFVQKLKYLDAQPPFDQFTSQEHRVLVKSNGTWKIASAITTETSMYQQNASENTLNIAGYAFLGANKVDDAIQIFELNTKMFPDSYNVWDSLGEAYAKAGKKELAIQNYEKSIKINPKSESGKAALADLKK